MGQPFESSQMLNLREEVTLPIDRQITCNVASLPKNMLPWMNTHNWYKFDIERLNKAKPFKVLCIGKTNFYHTFNIDKHEEKYLKMKT